MVFGAAATLTPARSRAQKKVDEAKTDEEKQAAQNELQKAQMPMCAPYGAPPSRRRMV